MIRQKFKSKGYTVIRGMFISGNNCCGIGALLKENGITNLQLASCNPEGIVNLVKQYCDVDMSTEDFRKITSGWDAVHSDRLEGLALESHNLRKELECQLS